MFYDFKGNAICCECAKRHKASEIDGPHSAHWFQCQECQTEFDTDDAGD